jgi:hypothetical protein
MTIKNDSTAAQQAVANSKIKTMSKAAQHAAKAKHGNEAAPGERQQTIYPLVGLGKNKQRYTRVNGDTSYHLMGVKTIEDKVEGKLYYLDPDLELPELVERNSRITNLYAGQLSDGTYVVLYSHVSGTKWYQSALAVISGCIDGWYAIIANKRASGYDLIKPPAGERIPEPKWQELPAFIEMIENAFADAMVTSASHPALRTLAGFAERQDDNE